MKAVKDKMPTGPGTSTLRVGPGLDQAGRRRGRRDVRRHGLHQGPVQHRHPGHDAGRVDVQAVRPDRRAARQGISTQRRSPATARRPSRSSARARTARSATSADEQFGNIDLQTATAHSVNTVYAQLNIKVGADKTRDAAIAAGMPGRHPRPGGQPRQRPRHGVPARHRHGQRLRDDRGARACGPTPYLVKKVTSADGSVNYKAQKQTKGAFDQDVAIDTTDAMQHVVTERHRRTARRRSAGRPPARPARRPTTRRRGSTGSPRSSPPRSASTATARRQARADAEHRRLR